MRATNLAFAGVSGLILMACANPYISVATQISCATAFIQTFGNDAYKDLTQVQRAALALRECKVLPPEATATAAAVSAGPTLIDANTNETVAMQPSLMADPVVLVK
jgi:hypothetical protein